MIPDDDFNDPLDSLLGNTHAMPAIGLLREAVLAKTLGVVRRRRRVRQSAWVLALAGCYLAGVMTTHLLTPTPEQTTSDNPAIAKTRSPVEQTPSAKIPVAVKKPGNPYDTLRRQGDRELRDPRRMASAVGRYSRAVALASQDQRAIDPEKDSWLLMALKLDQTTENKHAHPNH